MLADQMSTLLESTIWTTIQGIIHCYTHARTRTRTRIYDNVL